MKPSRTKEERSAEQIERGMAAARLIEDAVVIAFFEAERARYVDEMVSAPVDDDGKRRAAALKLQALEDLRKYLATQAALGRREQEKAKSHG